MTEVINGDFRDFVIPKGLTITDPPYNKKYKYDVYKDNLPDDEYFELIKAIPKPCVIIHEPEKTINIVAPAMGVKCEKIIAWVYNSMNPQQHRLISWWGCKPDLNKVKQPYKNLNDKRIQKRIANGSTGGRMYDWWEIQQVKNVSKEKTEHPCQIPEEIYRRIILTTAQPGEHINDVFGGSGTCGKVADELGFDCTLYDISGNYCNISKQRTNVTI